MSNLSNEPHITAVVREDGTGQVSIDGEASQVHADDVEGVRAAIIARVTEEAVARDQPVRVATTDLDGIYPLIVHPDGNVESDGPVIPVDTPADDSAPVEPVRGSHTAETPVVAEPVRGSHTAETPVVAEPVEAAEDPARDESRERGDWGASDSVASDADADADADDGISPADGPEHSAEQVGDTHATTAAAETGTHAPATDQEETQRPMEPVLIPPPPFGIEDLLAPTEPPAADGFVAPARRSTFQSFDTAEFAELGAPEEDREAVDDEPVLAWAPDGGPTESADAPSSVIAAPAERPVTDSAEQPVADSAASPTPERAPQADTDPPAPGLHAFSPPLELAEEPAAAENIDDSAPTLDDFLQSRPSAPEGPAKKGWQGLVRRLTGGLISPRPGRAERAHRDAIGRVQRGLKGPRTIVVLNPKGGAHKTTATLLLAATFGTHRGGSTLAWDNNETRGTLGWRAQPSRHSNTAVDLLQDLDRFADVRSARVGYLDNYVRAQGDAQFDVLASDEDAAASSTIDAEAFRSLHATLSRFYRVLVIDTGNNMRASNWEAAVDAADQIVVVTTVNEETAASAAWLLDGLRQKGHQDKVSQAVTILSSPGDTVQPELTQRLHAHFSALTRVVLEVPYDAGFQSGGPLNVDVLAPQTREAWLQVTAAVADGL